MTVARDVAALAVILAAWALATAVIYATAITLVVLPAALWRRLTRARLTAREQAEAELRIAAAHERMFPGTDAERFDGYDSPGRHRAYGYGRPGSCEPPVVADITSLRDRRQP
jgi:hypothetical protein